jgi:3-oxoadipate enol-lactonase
VLGIPDALGLEQAYVADCSWGGQIATHLGVKARERVIGVLMTNTPVGLSLGGHALEVLGTRWFGATGFWGNGVARSMRSPASQKAHPERVRAFASAFTSFKRAAVAVTVRTVLTRFHGLAEVLPRLTVPTTILTGAED